MRWNNCNLKSLVKFERLIDDRYKFWYTNTGGARNITLLFCNNIISMLIIQLQGVLADLLVRWGRESQYGELCFSPLASVEQGEVLWATPNFFGPAVWPGGVKIYAQPFLWVYPCAWMEQENLPSPSTGFALGKQLRPLSPSRLLGVPSSPCCSGPGSRPPQRGAVIQLLSCVWANQALRPVKLYVCGPKSYRPAPQWVPWSKFSLTWFCRWAKWDYYLDAAYRDSCAQDWVLAVVSPSVSWSQSDSQWLTPAGFPVVPLRWSQSRGSHKAPTMLGLWLSPRLSSHWRNWSLRETSPHDAAVVWARQGSKPIVASPTFLKQSVLVSVYRVLQPHPVV